MKSVLIFALFGVLVYFYLYIKYREKQLLAARKMGHKLNQEREAVLSFLDKVGSSVTDMTDLESMLNIVLDFIMEGTMAQAGAIFLLGDDQKQLWCRSVRGPFPPTFDAYSYVITKEKYLHEALKKHPVDIEEGVLGQVARTGNTCILDDQDDKGLNKGFTQDVEGMIVEPLKIRDRVLGVLAIVDKEVDTFDSNDERFVSCLSGQVTVMIDTARMYQDRAEKERIEKELAIARDIQRLLIPEKLPRILNFDVAFKSIPAKEVGGDFYDVFILDDQNVGIVVADVCGKGVPGALIMTMLRSVLRTQALLSFSPGKVLNRVNSLIYGDMKRDMFVTVLYAVLDVSTKKITFARAGHSPLLVYNSAKQKFESYVPDGIALGLVSGEEGEPMFSDQDVYLAGGDIIFFTTDGVEEAMNKDSELYGEERSREIIKFNKNKNSDYIINQILTDMQNFVKDAVQSDDITLGLIKVL